MISDVVFEGLVPGELPPWSVVSAKRVAHIGRVVTLLRAWAVQCVVPHAEAQGWIDAGRWHDALRDVDEPVLRAATGDVDRPYGMLHGPAAALRLAAEGETRTEVLEAIRWHTTGQAQWSRTGRALYMADFLEPGRSFMQQDRAFLASQVSHDFAGVFRQVVRMRMEWALREGKGLAAETVALWDSVR